ncbi:hypothetical protein ABE29_06425 [Cytobacillus firmus]|uniref:Substrate-specific component BioY of biotin ECF transporter n=1 Tax=Cytobacillus firmus TaxID=1399 RepID=A0A380XWE5_CYTFI|nr:Substrate-specific component BioY of biotin ECF transporter [Cytobacillus firmus]MBG9542467.1 hypothetical protein [Cytobacillus firmus]MBG9547800.1 hypothetical protein [Cytobacillus firmus]MBG9552164.1 hypothetical protein [Cytobacillus firmus]MBG9557541.1 hypothetical protein [Cytobacillus firmus]
MKTGLRTIDLTLAGMFVALMAVGANITSFVPFLVIGGVPITLQTFFAILAGAILGSRLGAITMAVYVFAGLMAYRLEHRVFARSQFRKINRAA